MTVSIYVKNPITNEVHDFDYECVGMYFDENYYGDTAHIVFTPIFYNESSQKIEKCIFPILALDLLDSDGELIDYEYSIKVKSFNTTVLMGCDSEQNQFIYDSDYTINELMSALDGEKRDIYITSAKYVYTNVIDISDFFEEYTFRYE